MVWNQIFQRTLQIQREHSYKSNWRKTFWRGRESLQGGGSGGNIVMLLKKDRAEVPGSKDDTYPVQGPPETICLSLYPMDVACSSAWLVTLGTEQWPVVAQLCPSYPCSPHGCLSFTGKVLESMGPACIHGMGRRWEITWAGQQEIKLLFLSLLSIGSPKKMHRGKQNPATFQGNWSFSEELDCRKGGDGLYILH